MSFAGVLRDIPLTTLAIAIALGWSLYQTGLGIAYFVEGVASHGGANFYSASGGPLTWTVGHRTLTFDQLVMGLVELGTALVAAALVKRFAQSGGGEATSA